MKNLKKLLVVALVVGLMGAVGVAYAAVAKTPAEITTAVTGQTVSEVNQERAAGQSYGAIANEAGKLEEFKAQMLEQRKALLDEQVKAGELNPEQAKTIYERMQDRMANCTGDGTGMCGNRGAGLGQGCGMGMGKGNGCGNGMGMMNGGGRGMGNGSCGQ